MVLISFREWLHSYIGVTYRYVCKHCEVVLISFREWLHSYILILKFCGKLNRFVLISFREWLHSYGNTHYGGHPCPPGGSHLFQRVASFLLNAEQATMISINIRFSSLSESGFIPTEILWVSSTVL